MFVSLRVYESRQEPMTGWFMVVELICTHFEIATEFR